MKDLSDLKHRIQAKTLNLVTQRNGVSVYQGQSSQGEVFIKIANNQTANDRYCEILDALKEFPLTPNVLNKFEWEGSSILVISAIEGTQVDQALKNCTRVQKISLLGNAGRALGELHRAIPQTRLEAANLRASVGTTGDSYDNALAETVNGLYKTEVIEYLKADWQGLADVQLATLNWVDWFNKERVHSALGYVSPFEFEAMYYDKINPLGQVA